MIDELEPEEMLMKLLEDEKVIINSHYYRSDWPSECQGTFVIGVLCNDVFCCCAGDCEEMMYKDLSDVFEYHRRDPGFGTIIWCIKNRKQAPEKWVIDYISNSDIWTLKDIQEVLDV